VGCSCELRVERSLAMRSDHTLHICIKVWILLKCCPGGCIALSYRLLLWNPGAAGVTRALAVVSNAAMRCVASACSSARPCQGCLLRCGTRALALVAVTSSRTRIASNGPCNAIRCPQSQHCSDRASWHVSPAPATGARLSRSQAPPDQSGACDTRMNHTRYWAIGRTARHHQPCVEHRETPVQHDDPHGSRIPEDVRCLQDVCASWMSRPMISCSS
jgi:hypothetical protein